MDNRKDLISEKGRYIGVDGCKNGWIVAVIDSGKLNVEKYDSITQIVSKSKGGTNYEQYSSYPGIMC